MFNPPSMLIQASAFSGARTRALHHRMHMINKKVDEKVDRKKNIY